MYNIYIIIIMKRKVFVNIYAAKGTRFQQEVRELPGYTYTYNFFFLYFNHLIRRNRNYEYILNK